MESKYSSVYSICMKEPVDAVTTVYMSDSNLELFVVGLLGTIDGIYVLTFGSTQI